MRLILLVTTIGAFTGSAAVAKQIPPPIESGEIYAETANGCGVVFKAAAGDTVTKAIEYFKKVAWYGRCVDGLADGTGQIAESGSLVTLERHTYVLGRNVADPWKIMRGEEKRETTYWSGDQFVTIHDEPKPFGPRWAYDLEGVYAPDRKSHIMTSREDRCMDEKVKKKTRKFGCSSSNNYRAYTIWVTINGVSKTVVCPDPRTSEGCDALWMAEGKPVFDSIQAFVAPFKAGIAAQRARYLARITPAWRNQAEARRNAMLANGTAEQLRDLVAAAVVAGDGLEAARLHQLLARRFSTSPAVSQSHLHLTALYCRQSAPALALNREDAAETMKIFQSEPCRRTGVAKPLLFSSKIVVDAAGWQAERDAKLAASWAAYDADRKRERDAYWGSMLGVVTGVIANAVTQPAATPTYSGAAATPPQSASGATNPNSTRQDATTLYPGQSYSNNVESVAHNPANDAASCIIAVDRYGYKANNIRDNNQGATFRNSCPFSVEVTWCSENESGGDCNPGYSNIGTVLGNSQRGISYDASKPVKINWAACRMGFTHAQSELSKRMQHACK